MVKHLFFSVLQVVLNAFMKEKIQKSVITDRIIFLIKRTKCSIRKQGKKSTYTPAKVQNDQINLFYE
jgi:hypothetical protein